MPIIIIIIVAKANRHKERWWLGPYTINCHLGKGIHKYSNEKGKSLKKKANISRLKPFNFDTQQAKREEPGAISSDEKSEEGTPAAVRANHLGHYDDMSCITNGQWLNVAFMQYNS